MKAWQGMECNADSTGEGCLYAQNTRFYIDGELQRRRGLTRFDFGTQARRIAQFWSPSSGLQTLVQTTGGAITAVTST